MSVYKQKNEKKKKFNTHRFKIIYIFEYPLQL